MNLALLTAVVGRARSHNGDWTYHLTTPGRWISMDSTNSTRSSYTWKIRDGDTPEVAAIPEDEHTPTGRLIIAAALLITVAIGLVLVIAADTSQAAEVVRSSWGYAASILRSRIWG